MGERLDSLAARLEESERELLAAEERAAVAVKRVGELHITVVSSDIPGMLSEVRRMKELACKLEEMLERMK